MHQLENIHHLLLEPHVQNLLFSHPNDQNLNLSVHSKPWRDILDDYLACEPKDELISRFRKEQLDRSPIDLKEYEVHFDRTGMSPKKEHEVNKMTAYIAKLVHDHNFKDDNSIRVVDVGAGQAYLTNALYARFGWKTLALDTSNIRRKVDFTGIAHRKMHITSTSLIQAIDDWIDPTNTEPTRVIIVALHACGSLVLDIFRAVLSLPSNNPWRPAFVVAVGCCYNLMDPNLDFPLSLSLRNHPHPLPRPLPASAYQMAAQLPNHWLDSPKHFASAKLAIKKVIWRSLIERLYARVSAASQEVTATGSTSAMRRLGRLNDSAYDSWEVFLARASERIGIDFTVYEGDPEVNDEDLQRRLECLHVLRCLLGPVVESYIVLDRIAWLHEELDMRRNTLGNILYGYDVGAVNLFDQGTGSGRNIALVLTPGVSNP